jgi:hypothetical protein
MTRTQRALIYSLLVFPGAGLWTLGEKIRSLIFMIPCLIVCIFLVGDIMHITQTMTQQMVDGLIPFDVLNLFLEIRRQIYADQGVRHYLVILVAAWILGGLSTYFVSKKQNSEQQ